MLSHWLCDSICVCLHLLCACETSWLIFSQKVEEEEKPQTYCILISFIKYSVRGQMSLRCPDWGKGLDDISSDRVKTIRYWVRLYHCLCYRKVPTRPPNPAWEANLDEMRLLWTQCSGDQWFLEKKSRLERYNLLQKRTHSVFSQHFFFLRTLFFPSYFVSLDSKWIIQSVSLVHITLHQFDFVWCSGEGKKRWYVTCTLSWALFVSAREQLDETSKRPGAKDTHYFVSAYANVFEDYIWEKAFQTPHTFSVWELN